jgi:hypothetical protein
VLRMLKCFLVRVLGIGGEGRWRSVEWAGLMVVVFVWAELVGRNCCPRRLGRVWVRVSCEGFFRVRS